MLVKVTAHHKAEVKPLAVVHDEIVALLKQERGVAAAKAAAEAAVAKLDAGEKLDAVAKTLGMHGRAGAVRRPWRSVDSGRTAHRDLRRAASRAATPVIKSATLDDGSTAVFVVTRTRVGRRRRQPALVTSR